MDVQRLIKTGLNSRSWRKTAAQLRKSANLLWKIGMSTWSKANNAEHGEERESSRETALTYLMHAQMLYGFALENALKSHFIDDKPETVQFDLEMDGSGQLKSAELKQVKVNVSGSGHDLRTLAECAGLFDPSQGFAKDDEERTHLKGLLDYLSELIIWEGRYPIPNRSENDDSDPEEIPDRYYGDDFRKTIDPILDHML